MPRNTAGLTHLAQGTNVDIEGPGEILRITALPTPGERRLTLGPNGLHRRTSTSSAFRGRGRSLEAAIGPAWLR